ncbi:MAG: biotin/lipoyl-binding protein [Bacteroidales bacterium]|nr:biotin/lipoyl-binding protein [Bacteroidales bacterium]MDD4670159.1 biotin/lipoyl-binding protein [Bacteroidales bacterium]
MKEYKLKINGNAYNVVINEVEGETAALEVNGTPFHVEFEKPIAKPKAVKIVRPSTPTPAAPTAQVTPKAAEAPAGGTQVTSPLPGVILSVAVKEGDTVKKGQSMMVLEAMKMENSIDAPVDGTVKSLKARQGDSVLEGALLVIIG